MCKQNTFVLSSMFKLVFSFFLQFLQHLKIILKKPLLQSWKTNRAFSILDLYLHVLKESGSWTYEKLLIHNSSPHVKPIVVEFNNKFRYSSTSLNLLLTPLTLLCMHFYYHLCLNITAMRTIEVDLLPKALPHSSCVITYRSLLTW